MCKLEVEGWRGPRISIRREATWCSGLPTYPGVVLRMTGLISMVQLSVKGMDSTSYNRRMLTQEAWCSNAVEEV